MALSPRKSGEHGGSLVRNVALLAVVALLFLAMRDTSVGQTVGTRVDGVREYIAGVIHDGIDGVFTGGTGGGELP